MKKPIIAALVSTQLLAAPAAAAADLAAAQDQRVGAFGGLRLRVPLDGRIGERPIRAGLTLAPTLHGRKGDGETRMRIGEGLEFGYRSNRPLSFSLAGRDLPRRLGAAQGDDGGGGVPTWALIVGGVAVTLGLAYWGFSEAMDCDAEEECS